MNRRNARSPEPTKQTTVSKTVLRITAASTTRCGWTNDIPNAIHSVRPSPSLYGHVLLRRRSMKVNPPTIDTIERITGIAGNYAYRVHVTYRDEAGNVDSTHNVM